MEKQPNNIWDIFHLLHNIQQISLAYLHKKKIRKKLFIIKVGNQDEAASYEMTP